MILAPRQAINVTGILGMPYKPVGKCMFRSRAANGLESMQKGCENAQFPSQGAILGVALEWRGWETYKATRN